MTARASFPRSRLPQQFAGIYTLLALYGSLYPFSGWRDTGADPIAFLSADWPRYLTGFDLGVNVLAYLPLGFLWAAALSGRLPAWAAGAATVLGGSAFSLGIETVQNYLPSRVASNVDWGCNTLGAALGALAGVRWGRHLLDGGRLHAWRERRFLRGPVGDAGLLLVGLWLLTQLSPETFLFGGGNLRALFGLPAALPFAAERFFALETTAVAAQTLAIALVGTRLAANHPLLLPPALIGAALVVKSCALLATLNGVHGLAWATPGSLAGLALGGALWIGFAHAPLALRQIAAAMALMLAGALANLMPDNPYLEDTLRVSLQAHFLNFNGLTRFATALWPYLALAWLMMYRSKR